MTKLTDMKSKNYITPRAVKHTTGLRMSILAGSSADSRAFNGTTHGNVNVSDMPIEARGRQSID